MYIAQFCSAWRHQKLDLARRSALDVHSAPRHIDARTKPSWDRLRNVDTGAFFALSSAAAFPYSMSSIPQTGREGH